MTQQADARYAHRPGQAPEDGVTETIVLAGQGRCCVMHPACDHAAASPVFNASSVPVRLICTCGEEWRVVPVDALVTLPPSYPAAGICRCGSDGDNPCVCPVYARSLSGPMSGLVTPPRCRQGHLLSVCECWRNNRTGERE